MVCPYLLIYGAVGDIYFDLFFLMILSVHFDFSILVILSLFVGDAGGFRYPATIAIFPEFRTCIGERIWTGRESLGVE